MFCAQCGTEQQGEMPYCPKCGRRFGEPVPSSTQPSVNERLSPRPPGTQIAQGTVTSQQGWSPGKMMAVIAGGILLAIVILGVILVALPFGLGFWYGGPGYGGSGFDPSKSGNVEASSPEQKKSEYEATLTANPNDIDALLGLATVYQQNDELVKAASFLERVLEVDHTQWDVYLRLANLYLNPDVADYEAAATVLNKAAQVDPNNPEVFLKLGTAQNALGHKAAAILAWNRYLELSPDGDLAPVVREQLEKLKR